MSKIRSLASQLCSIFPYCCLQVASGSTVGFQIILIAELYKSNSEIPTSLEELSWFAALDFFKLAGSLITGLLMHRFGSRATALTAALIFVGANLLYHYSTDAVTLSASRTLVSLVGMQTLFVPYISEISEPHLRGPFLATAEMAFATGAFFTLLLGSLMYWRTIALVSLIFPTLAAINVLVTPNSPAWLANKRRFNEAEKAMCWLRGWARPQQVQAEFGALVKSLDAPTPEGKLEVVGCQQRSRRFSRLFLQRSFYVPLGTISLIFLLYSFSGVDTMENYATVVFRELNSPIEESVATAIMSAMGIVGNLFVMLVIHRTGKRKLVFLSVVVTGSCQLTVAIVGFLKLQGDYLWLPPIGVIVANLANASGIGALVFMVAGEIFPASVRYIGTSISISIKMMLKSVMSKFFLYAVDAVTLPGVFLFFAVVNLIALIVYYFLFPETEGRSLGEIEDHFKNAKKREK